MGASKIPRRPEPSDNEPAMSRPNESPGERLRATWDRLAPLPGGKWLFSSLLGRMVPYSSSIGATVREFAPGRVVVTLPDRRRVRNHLRSIHAIAIANLGELATGLALIAGLDSTVRAILVGIDVRYTKKARGMLTAEATCDIPHVTESMDHEVVAELRDTAGDVVATVTAKWRLGPAKSASA